MFVEKLDRITDVLMDNATMTAEEKGDAIEKYIDAACEVANIAELVMDIKLDGNPDGLTQEEYTAALNKAIEDSRKCDEMTRAYIGEPMFDIKDGDYVDLVNKSTTFIHEMYEDYFRGA